jgi:Xaa-Pro aminopeptidase
MATPRLDRLRNLLNVRRCTHLLISDAVDAEYASGFRSSNLLLLVSRKRAILLADFRYRQAARVHCRAHPAFRFAEVRENGFERLARLVPRNGRVGIQADVVTLENYRRLQKALSRRTFVRISGDVSACFSTKLPREIASLSRAARIGDAAFAAFVKKLRIGITEKKAAEVLERECARRGSEKPSFDTIVLFGGRSALPHGRPSGRRLKRGNFVLADFGCMVNGFCSDMTRTIVAGRATPRQRRLYEIVRRAQLAALESVKPGAVADAIDRTARRIIAAAGYGAAFGHATGHGVGLRIHENPRLRKRENSIMEPGMVVTVEPGIYLPGAGGVRIEDMVLVTASGHRVLTQTGKELMEIRL